MSSGILNVDVALQISSEILFEKSFSDALKFNFCLRNNGMEGKVVYSFINKCRNQHENSGFLSLTSDIFASWNCLNFVCGLYLVLVISNIKIGTLLVQWI